MAILVFPGDIERTEEEYGRSLRAGGFPANFSDLDRIRDKCRRRQTETGAAASAADEPALDGGTRSLLWVLSSRAWQYEVS